MFDVHLFTFSLNLIILIVIFVYSSVTIKKLVKMTKIFSQIQNSIQSSATSKQIEMISDKLDTGLIDAMFMVENNIAHRVEEVLQETVELKTKIVKLEEKLKISKENSTSELNSKVEMVMFYSQDNYSSEEIANRLNMSLELVEDIIQLSK